MRSQSGVSLVSTMVDIALIAVSALAVAALVTYNRVGEMRMKRWTQGEQALVTSATALQDMKFTKLREFCAGKLALNLTRPVLCGAPRGTLSSGAAVAPGNDPLTGEPKVVDVLRDWNGDRTADGQTCVELVSCMEKAAGRMLEVTLRGIWVDPAVNGKTLIAAPKVLTFRKAR